MRKINLIVIHCSATCENVSFTEHDLDRYHRQIGFNGAGYHYYIRRNGDIKRMRPVERIGAHAKGHNSYSIGICYEGGLDNKGKPKDTRTRWQKYSLRVLIKLLMQEYPDSEVCGHRDLSPDLNNNGIVEPHEWIKMCPCYDVRAEMESASWRRPFARIR
ncbi:N-acetylmuramoyl-L-alanine amidase [Bacteroides sp. 224]|uniref:N-acetylmuramoyl-L-alanine amidase n=1 Tax=Bacteroides sp. 224 TaxID=2302936 RepID=UPI0013D55529|nr:N-acetylmuramoyl-L-alanine amidase [Bacteroides sp. 224]NDV66759.1 N-acetylmuramoyl-L-alanine amidase [Bacteroides sp. 224]